MRRLALAGLAGIVLATSWSGGTAVGSPGPPTTTRTLSTAASPAVATVVSPAVATVVSPAVATAASTAVSPVTVGGQAWVAVSVATLWRLPRSRVVDRPALANPANIRLWLSRMTLADRLGLNGRADTQALLGDRVIVTARSGAWVKVVVPDQPTPLDRRGYPGWLPTAQLTAQPQRATGLLTTVVVRTTWLRTDNASATAVTEVSFGTRFRRVGVTGAWVRVATPTGEVRRVQANAVTVRASGVPALPRTGGDVVRTAQMFTGLPYLWAGRSGFGFDCSGLTSLDYRVHGLTIPRDADAQALGGAAASRNALRPGDLLFYATRAKVHHVSMYAGSGRMVHAPRTGLSVQTIAVSTASYARQYAGARRFIG